MNTSKKLLIAGGIGIVIFNPLSVNLIGDVAVTAVNKLVEWLVVSSSYTMAVSGTLIAVGLLLAYEARNKKHNAKLKKLKTKKTDKAGEYIV